MLINYFTISISINGKIQGIGLRIYANGKEVLEEFKDDKRVKIIKTNL